MSSLMILGSVPLYNIMAVVILMLEAPTAQAQTGNMAEKLKKSVKGILTNPILLGIAAGFAWSMLHISMPAMLDKALSNVAGLTSPLALLAIGAGFKGQKALGYLKPTAVATVVNHGLQGLVTLLDVCDCQSLDGKDLAGLLRPQLRGLMRAVEHAGQVL
jgi:predicted permease